MLQRRRRRRPVLGQPDWKRYPEFRCTRNQPYPRGTPVESRQGYYIRAPNERAALEEMRRDFPRDWEGFTCDRWKEPGR